MSCVQFTPFTAGDAGLHHSVVKVKTFHISTFNALNLFLYDYYEKPESEFEGHLHYENKRCNGSSEIDAHLWNSVASGHKEVSPTSGFPVYYVCFVRKYQRESNTNSNGNGEGEQSIEEQSSGSSPMRDVRRQSTPESNCIALRPPREKHNERPVREHLAPTPLSQDGRSSKKRAGNQGIPERPTKSTRLTSSTLPQALENKLTGVLSRDDNRRRVVVGVDDHSSCAVWAARNTLGNIYLRKSAFDMQGKLLCDEEGTKAQKAEDTDFSHISGSSSDSSWDVIKDLIEKRLDALETISPKRQPTRAQSAVSPTTVSPSQVAVKDGATTTPTRERRIHQVSPSVSPAQRKPYAVHAQRSTVSAVGFTSNEQSNWNPSDADERNVKVRFIFWRDKKRLVPSKFATFTLKTSVITMFEHAKKVLEDVWQYSATDVKAASIGNIHIYTGDRYQPLRKYVSGNIEAGQHHALTVTIEWRKEE